MKESKISIILDTQSKKNPLIGTGVLTLKAQRKKYNIEDYVTL